MIAKGSWIGAQGAAFERACLAFEALGYRRPAPDDGSNGKGAYVMNIIAQYRADMTEDQALAVIKWSALASIASLTERGEDYTLEEIARLYGG